MKYDQKERLGLRFFKSGPVENRMSFWILTDACCDLSAEYIRRQKQFKVIPMMYSLDDEEFVHDPLSADVDERTDQFYDRMRSGAMTHTAQINEQTWREWTEGMLKEGKDVLILAFSGGLSSTAQSAAKAAESLKAGYPDRQLACVDSLCASSGQGLFIHYVLQYREEGHSLSECTEYALRIRRRINHWFTVEDMVYLKRGGRISAASYVAATMLNIKPVLNVDPKGHLVNREKVVGRKRSLKTLVSMAARYADHPENQTFFLSHGQCEDDARWVAEKLRQECGVTDIVMGHIGPVIGAHTGPGILAVFFMDKDGAGRLEAE